MKQSIKGSSHRIKKQLLYFCTSSLNNTASILKGNWLTAWVVFKIALSFFCLFNVFHVKTTTFYVFRTAPSVRESLVTSTNAVFSNSRKTSFTFVSCKATLNRPFIVSPYRIVCAFVTVTDPKISKDNLSAPSSFIANAHKEIYAFSRKKAAFWKKIWANGGSRLTASPLWIRHRFVIPLIMAVTTIRYEEAVCLLVSWKLTIRQSFPKTNSWI